MTESTFDRLEKRLPAPGQKDRRQLLVVGAALLAGAVAGVVVGRMSVDAPPAQEASPLSVNAAERFIVLPELTVNLRPTAAVKLMKIGVTLSTDGEHRAALAALEPVLVDGMQQYLRTLDENDLEGRTGVETLRAELLRRIRLMADPVPVESVLLRTLILQ
ncbi:flagellar basal body-associated FliL family protein [Niveispirillum irakense]|uniref:flagellar basal body-associated FliL family protein n=1 Tax=Niveispirillum irakense TaxID=34011 RepID=UPI00041818CF|nr:flagellar basal body-associated FliL family protein [Niveispirillum irakense]